MTDPAVRRLAVEHRLGEGAATRLAALVRATADPLAPSAIREPADVLERHVADSLVALELERMRSAPAIADIGAGAGFPGLALAAALPGAHVRLVESVRRKCEFIARAARAAELRNVEVVHARAEAWTAGLGLSAIVTARALAALPVVLEYAAPLLAPGGALVAWKGRRDRDEEAAADRAAEVLLLEREEVRRVRPYARAGERHLYVYRKAGPTPERFPRRPGMARKRPLGGAPRGTRAPSDRVRR